MSCDILTRRPAPTGVAAGGKNKKGPRSEVAEKIRLAVGKERGHERPLTLTQEGRVSSERHLNLPEINLADDFLPFFPSFFQQRRQDQRLQRPTQVRHGPTCLVT